MDKVTYERIAQKKEFSQIPKKDIEKAFGLFEKRQTSEEDKIKLTRDLLRKVYFAFGSLKLLNLNILEKKSAEEILLKHISTRERLSYYSDLYKKIFQEYRSCSVIDLGAGINGLSYNYIKEVCSKVNYMGVEAVGQLVNLMNEYFENKNLSGKAICESLFDLEKIIKIIKTQKEPRIIFLFKTLDSLEMIQRNYSKEMLNEIVPLADKVVVSFATSSLISKTKFKVKRYWFENFINENFKVLDNFELGNERYFVFKKK